MDQFFLSLRLIVNWPHRLRHSIIPRLLSTSPSQSEPNSFRYPSFESGHQNVTALEIITQHSTQLNRRWRSSLVHLSLFTQRSLSLILSLGGFLLSSLYFPADTQLNSTGPAPVNQNKIGISSQPSLFIHPSFMVHLKRKKKKNGGGVRFLDCCNRVHSWNQCCAVYLYLLVIFPPCHLYSHSWPP